jgi:predicted metal-dependent phosphoesterase TrpH
MIDLQTHSIYSDGSLSPTELVVKAREVGLKAIALTDHDTVEGIAEFLAAGEKHHQVAVPGVELSAESSLPTNGHLHILGLFIDHQSQELQQSLAFLRRHRQERALNMIDKLNRIGFYITPEELQAVVGAGVAARPHIARIMLDKGYVKSMHQAFIDYLSKGAPGFVEKVKYSDQEVIRLINNNGGLSIAAHPHLMNYDTFEELAKKILELQEMGLDGVEVYYPGYSRNFILKLKKMAEESGLLLSGGSDFHGTFKDNIELGTGRGDLNVPNEVYDALKSAVSEPSNIH